MPPAGALTQRHGDEQTEDRNRNSNSVMANRLACDRDGTIRKQGKGGSRRPGTKSLWLLPSGPDQVGDSAVRRLPDAHMVEGCKSCKSGAPHWPSLAVHPQRRKSAKQVQGDPDARPLILLPMLAAAVLPDTSPRAPITVTGHQWAPFISPMGEPFRAHTPSTTRSQTGSGRPIATMTGFSPAKKWSPMPRALRDSR